MTERITPTNMNDGTWPKKYDNDKHERLNVIKSKNQNHIIKTTNLFQSYSTVQVRRPNEFKAL